MTFFANSGAAWPNSEQKSRQAGAQSLEAISQVWKLFADLERRPTRSNIDAPNLLSVAKLLSDASGAYAQMAKELSGNVIDSMTPAELDIAGIDIGTMGPRLHYYYPNNLLNIGDLYRELAQRTAHLASLVTALDFRRANEDIAAPVFQIMRQLELLTQLARIIAVVNQRTNDDTFAAGA